MSLWQIILLSIIGANLTHYIAHKNNIGAIRASAGLTILFVFINNFFLFSLQAQAIFFGATFVGMASKKRMGHRSISLASFIYSLVIFYLIGFAKGMGGALGTSAFIGCSTTAFFIYFYKKKEFTLFI